MSRKHSIRVRRLMYAKELGNYRARERIKAMEVAQQFLSGRSEDFSEDPTRGNDISMSSSKILDMTL